MLAHNNERVSDEGFITESSVMVVVAAGRVYACVYLNPVNVIPLRSLSLKHTHIMGQ